MSAVRTFIAALLLVSFCVAARADVLKTTPETKLLADQIMAKVGAGDVVSGVNLMRPYLIIPPAEFDSMLEQLRLQQPVMNLRFGKAIGYEFIREDKVGQHLLRLVYVHLFEKHLMRWSFFFYRSADGWVLNTFKTDDDPRLLFQ